MPTRATSARLAVLLGLLFLLLVAPSAVLLVQTRRQIAFEAYHQYRTLADELALRIDAELQRLVAAEEARGYADYRFVVVAGDPATSTALQRSPLAIYPVRADLPGVDFSTDVGDFDRVVYLFESQIYRVKHLSEVTQLARVPRSRHAR